MILDTINITLETFKAEIGADSCTFYVRDPFWQEELRLIAMPGVHIKEPMHGFAFPPHSTAVVSDGATEIFSSETESEKRLRELMVPARDLIAAGKRFLFGDFVERERIKSSARLMHKVNNRLEAVLFVNFVEEKKFTAALKKRLRGLLSKLVVDLTKLQAELRASESDAARSSRARPPSGGASP